MIQWAKRALRDMSFRRKTTLICILISLIPLLLLGSFGSAEISNRLMEREEATLTETMRQETDFLLNKLNLYQNALNIVSWDETLKNAMIQTYPTNYDLYMTYKDTVDSLFLSVRSLNPDITRITIYTESDINPHGELVRPLKEAADLPWYGSAGKIAKSFYTRSEDGQSLYLVCRLYYSFPAPASYLCITIDMGHMMQSASSLLDTGYGFLLTDAAGNLLYDNTASNTDPPLEPLTAEQLRSGAPDLYAVRQSTIEADSTGSGWTAYLYRPLRELQAATIHFAATIAVLIGVCVLLSLLSAALLARVVTAPLEHLAQDMGQVEQGNYQIDIPEDPRGDEVGHLIQAFRLMVRQLNYYINRVLVGAIRQKDYELRLLQSQINPHFLYNALSLINSRAILAGQEDISRMALLLSSFYRTALNKGKPLTTVQAELENTRSYIAIQQIMHANSFDVDYEIEIEESALQYSVLNMILQPLAENAILHGLDPRETPGVRVLTVSCREDGEDILFAVTDNGCGMDEETCKRILEVDSSGYGVRNVHQRIRLQYGDAYGLEYRSTPGFGTRVQVRIPKVPVSEAAEAVPLPTEGGTVPAAVPLSA